jgi:hypothetical protein
MNIFLDISNSLPLLSINTAPIVLSFSCTKYFTKYKISPPWFSFLSCLKKEYTLPLYSFFFYSNFFLLVYWS